MSGCYRLRITPSCPQMSCNCVSSETENSLASGGRPRVSAVWGLVPERVLPSAGLNSVIYCSKTGDAVFDMIMANGLVQT